MNFIPAPVFKILTVYLIPIAFFIVLIALLWLIRTIPPSAWIIRRASRIRKGVLTIIADDQGKLRFDIMQTDIGQGILSGNEVNYLFTPRPTYEIPKQAVLEEDELGNQKVEILQIGLSEIEKAAIDELNLYKHHMVGVNLPVLLGYAGKSVATTPRMLNYMKEAHDVSQQVEEEIKDLPEKEKDKSRKEKYKLLNLLDPRIFKEYVKWTLGPAIIDALCLTHEKIGAEQVEKPSGWGRTLPLVLIVVMIVAAVVLWQSGILNQFMGK